MSLHLVKKSLMILEDSKEPTVVTKSKTSDKITSSKKELYKLDKRKKAIQLVEKVKKDTIAERNTDKIAINIKRLQKLSEISSINNKLENKVNKRLLKSSKKEKEKSNQKSVFTEEDFLKFEREYFVRD